MIQLVNISKRYNSKKGNNTTALDNINLKLGDKGLTFILGKSGSGKSTLLNILGGLDKQSSGNIIINNKDTNTFKSSDWDMYRNTYVGFVFQEFNLLDSYDVYNNIKLSLELQNKKISDNDIKEVLSKVSLEDISKRKINELSGGQKQRVAIARAIIKKPEILLCDEPTGNLDSTTSKEIFNILKELSKNTLVIVVSHDEESASIYADRIIRISDGKIVSDTLDIDITSNKELVLKKAHLPFMYSFKMGIDSLFKKKIKFIFSLISLTLCLGFLGFVLSTNNNGFNKEFLKNFANHNSSEVKITKYSGNVDYGHRLKDIFSATSSLSESDPITVPIDNETLKEIEENTNLKWNASYTIRNIDGNVSYGEKDYNVPLYYEGGYDVNFSTFDVIDTSKLIGNVDNDSIVISSHIADYIIYNGIKAKDSITEYSLEYLYKPNSYEDIINDNVYIKLNNFEYINVSGIVEVDLSQYETLKNYNRNKLYYNTDVNPTGLSNLSYDLNYSQDINVRVYISNEKLNYYKSITNNVTNSTYYNKEFRYNDTYYDDVYYGYLLNNSLIYTKYSTIYMDDLNNDDMVINTGFLNTITNNDYQEKLDSYLLNNENSNEEEFLLNYLNNNDIIGKKILSAIHDNDIYESTDNYKEYTIIGVIIDSKEGDTAYLGKVHVSKLVKDTVTLSYVYTNVDNLNDMKNILKYYPLNNNNILSETYYSKAFVVYPISCMFKNIGYIGMIVLSVLSFLFLSNLILNSIKLRKKEMGILRALGCKSLDVLKIFIYESLTLCLISVILSSCILPIVCNSLNNFMHDMYYDYNVFIFDFEVVIYMLIFTFILTVVITLLGSIRVIKQKPMEVILDK